MGNRSTTESVQDITTLVTQLHLAGLDKEYLKTRVLGIMDSVKRQSRKFTRLNYLFKCVLYPSSVSLLLYIYQKWSGNDYIFWSGIILQLAGYTASAIADTMQIPRKLPLIKKYKDDLEHEMWCYISLINDYSDLNHQEAFKLVCERCEAIITKNERYLRQIMTQTRNASGSYRNTEGPVLAETDAFVQTRPITPRSPRPPIITQEICTDDDVPPQITVSVPPLYHDESPDSPPRHTQTNLNISKENINDTSC